MNSNDPIKVKWHFQLSRIWACPQAWCSEERVPSKQARSRKHYMNNACKLITPGSVLRHEKLGWLLHFSTFRQVSVFGHVLTLKVLNFWKFTSYCSSKLLWSGMGEVVPARTSPTLHPPSPLTVHQLSWLAL